MNWKRGFRRIAFLGAVIAAGCCAVIAVGFITIVHDDAERHLRREWHNYWEKYDPCRLYRLVPENGGKILYECMDIKEFRQQYPAYNDIGDVELASRLHATYYDDVVSFGEFAQAFGLPEPLEGFVLDPYPVDDIDLTVAEKKRAAKARLKELENGFWVKWSTPKLVALCGVTGSTGGAFGFCVVWLVYKLLEWIALGFMDDAWKAKTAKRNE